MSDSTVNRRLGKAAGKSLGSGVMTSDPVSTSAAPIPYVRRADEAVVGGRTLAGIAIVCMVVGAAGTVAGALFVRLAGLMMRSGSLMNRVTAIGMLARGCLSLFLLIGGIGILR